MQRPWSGNEAGVGWGEWRGEEAEARGGARSLGGQVQWRRQDSESWVLGQRLSFRSCQWIGQVCEKEESGCPCTSGPEPLGGWRRQQ